MKSKDKNYIFAVRVSNKKLKKEWTTFCNAKGAKQGKELKKALYEFMEREGWDFENQQFIDFDDNDDEFSLGDKHTHIDQKSIERSVDLIQKPKIQEPEKNPVKSIEKGIKNDTYASSENTRQTMLLKVNTPSNEKLFTYAFCKLCRGMKEVHYEQIEQLSLPFFKTRDERAIKNKPNILIGNQCVVRKLSDKKWYKILPSGIQKFTTENIHLDKILEKEIELDFLEALKP